MKRVQYLPRQKSGRNQQPHTSPLLEVHPKTNRTTTVLVAQYAQPKTLMVSNPQMSESALATGLELGFGTPWNHDAAEVS